MTTILAPHLDDAVLSCWSVLAAGDEVGVVNVFAGVPRAGTAGAWDRETGASDSVARMREREREDVEALALAGCVPVNLGFLEEQYRERPVEPGEVLAALPEELDVVYGPAGIGGHADHLLVRSLMGPLRERGADVRLYADLPYCARRGWPEWVTGEAAHPEAGADWDLGGLDAQLGLRPCAVRLEPAEQERKRSVLAVYRTQFAALTAGSWRLTDPGVLPFEVLWEPLSECPPSIDATRA
ncbi:MAG: PIG-L family deacetylase [Actinomycetota bacterium]|nr:PIG-L family deacetylase [Actinomycetota bacterium]